VTAGLRCALISPSSTPMSQRGTCRPSLKHRLRGACKLRHFGLSNCVRVLHARREWCLAFARFDMSLEREQPGSLFSSDFCRHICRHYIPDWGDMRDKERQEAEAMFLSTGQTCNDMVYQHNRKGSGMKTRLLFVEQAADAFQPFNRTQHSTWVMALRCDYRVLSHEQRVLGCRCTLVQ
jgi:hypothetical protein